MRDLFNLVNPVPAIAPAAAITDNTAAAGAWVSRLGYSSLTYLMITGTDADADVTFAVTLQDADADDQSDAAAVTVSSALLGTLALAGWTFANDGQCFKLGYVGNKKWTKITVTPSNNTGNFFVAAIALLGHPDNAATPNPPVSPT